MWVLLLCLGGAWAAAAAPVTTATTTQAPPTQDHSTQLVDWLLKYGYLPAPDSSTGQLQAWTTVTSAVRSMQRFAGINETGVLDEETLALMETRRCSLPDQEEPPGGATLLRLRSRRSRSRRSEAGATWRGSNINWRLQSYPPSLPRDTVRSLVYYALRVWAQPTPLDFHEVGLGATDLQVDFHHGYHGDDYPFDGVGGAVGHAFFPSDPLRAGGVHLDSEEEWAFRQTAAEGTDLFTVLLHELGHALGLSHSSSRHSVMRPYYQGPAGDPLHYRLGPSDLESITQLYGKRRHQQSTDSDLDSSHQLRHKPHPHPPHPHPHPHHREHNDRCNTSFDAVAKIRGETFFFKGLSMWRVSSSGLVSSRAAAVRRMWRSLPLDLRLSAVLERPSDHAILFISGSQVWLFRDLSLQDGFPAPLSSLHSELREEQGEEQGEQGERPGLRWDPHQGLSWGNTGAETPAADGEWTRLLECGVSGITTDSQGAVYLFHGASYWKFPSPGSSPEVGFPRSIGADWLDCPDPGTPSAALPLPTPPAGGRHELREGRGQGGGQGRERGGPWGRDDKDWTHCWCQSRATDWTGETLILVWTFVMSFIVIEETMN
ncbi:unnamed protein product [Knipowitschia caucasica]